MADPGVSVPPGVRYWGEEGPMTSLESGDAKQLVELSDGAAIWQWPVGAGLQRVAIWHRPSQQIIAQVDVGPRQDVLSAIGRLTLLTSEPGFGAPRELTRRVREKTRQELIDRRGDPVPWGVYPWRESGDVILDNGVTQVRVDSLSSEGGWSTSEALSALVYADGLHGAAVETLRAYTALHARARRTEMLLAIHFGRWTFAKALRATLASAWAVDLPAGRLNMEVVKLVRAQVAALLREEDDLLFSLYASEDFEDADQVRQILDDVMTHAVQIRSVLVAHVREVGRGSVKPGEVSLRVSAILQGEISLLEDLVQCLETHVNALDFDEWALREESFGALCDVPDPMELSLALSIATGTPY